MVDTANALELALADTLLSFSKQPKLVAESGGLKDALRALSALDIPGFEYVGDRLVSDVLAEATRSINVSRQQSMSSHGQRLVQQTRKQQGLLLFCDALRAHFDVAGEMRRVVQLFAQPSPASGKDAAHESVKKIIKLLNFRPALDALSDAQLAEWHTLQEQLLQVLEARIVPDWSSVESIDLHDSPQGAAMRREQAQLTEFGGLNAAIGLFDSRQPEVLLGALRFATALVYGGNTEVQEVIYFFVLHTL